MLTLWGCDWDSGTQLGQVGLAAIAMLLTPITYPYYLPV